MGKKKTNWDILSEQNPQDTTKYRDVYDDQQLERTRLHDKQSPTFRIVLTVIISILAALATYLILSIGSFAVAGFSHMNEQGNVVNDSSSPASESDDKVSQELYNEYGDLESMPAWAQTNGYSYIIWEGDAGYKRKSDGKFFTNEQMEVKFQKILKKAEKRKTELESEYGIEREDSLSEDVVKDDSSENTELHSAGYYFSPTIMKVFISFIVGLLVFGIVYSLMMRNLEAQNLMNDTSDINQYTNDQHIALPEEVQRKFDWFPDVGAHSNVQVSSMISHMALTNKGLKKIEVAKRANEDIYDEDGDIELYKGEILVDDEDNPITEKMPIIDEPFMDALFDASLKGAGLSNKEVKEIMKYYKRYDPTKIPYNPGGSDRTKQGGSYDTVAEMINHDWSFPLYEPQRPAGAYIVDTEPVNTMVLAITRAGKGQTIIEPTLDMWLREKRPNNIVANDPKGELLVKHYVRATVRGFQVVQFNLINAMKTDIYNPLGMAADAAREGDFTKAAMYVENIADVFFPLDGGDDPVWPNAANNAFKRASYGLIDYYLEEEKELRLLAERTGMEDKILESKVDEMWGKVTLYNCYQLFVQLTSKKLKNPAVEFTKNAKAGKYDNLSDDEYQKELEKVQRQSMVWEDKPEADLLTLYFNATDMLPKNQMRTLVANANNALRAMAGAEKMMASVYGIAITAMSFFTDPTISTLTSGTPSQNVDLAGMSFPRRLGVRFNSDFVKMYHLTGQQVKWDAFEDAGFTKPYDKDFTHEDLVTREGWIKYYFKGKFPKDIAYVRARIINPNTGMLIRTFYFQFKKMYQTSLDGRYYVTDPVLGDKIVKNGILTELKPFKRKDGSIVYKRANTTFKQMKVVDIEHQGGKQPVQTNAIIQKMARYAEKPKMVFLVTPPHLMKYAKLILILLKQLVDLNFDQSYMTKANQKPLYKTRFMLDELGNLQSEGHGISGFETMLSIGLGQEQQFTLILQTLQQLRDVYGDSVDKIVQGNTSNIIFLKSTDDSMLDTLQKMSGTTHKSFVDDKTVTRDMEKLFLKNEGKVSYRMTAKEMPVISYNDMAFISERNSIVFRAGDSPIWNRNETILPMSWRLFQNTIQQPGKDYSLQTIPTLSSAIEFDVRKNQPDFRKMLDKRMEQAYVADDVKEMYSHVYGYSEYDISQLDPDNYADEIMDLINRELNHEDYNEDGEYEMSEEEMAFNAMMEEEESWFDRAEENEEQMEATREAENQLQTHQTKLYAGGLLSKDDLFSMTTNRINYNMENVLIRAYVNVKGDMWQDDGYFEVKNGNLYGVDGELYIKMLSQSDDLRTLNQQAKDKDSKVYADDDINLDELNQFGSFQIMDAFYLFLVSLDSWDFAEGRFDEEVRKLLSE